MSWLVPEHIPLPVDFRGLDPTSSVPYEGFSQYERHLPHWRLDGGCYLVTFRLGDSLPKAIETEMRREAEAWKMRLEQAVATCQGRLSAEEAASWNAFQRVQMRKLDGLLDEGHGECLLGDAENSTVMEAALHHFEGQRCEMLAYTIMPNHVHVLCRPLKGHRLEDLCGSWKWFTAQQIQRRLGRTGGLWQEETFDRIIRDAAHYTMAVRYIAKNPLKARLVQNKARVWFCDAMRKANGWA